jgi:hypothetical protein
VLRRSKLIETVDSWLPGNEILTANSQRVSFGGYENVLKSDSDNNCTIL